MRILLALLAAGTALGAAPPPGEPARVAAVPGALPGFAAQLAQMPPILGPSAWTGDKAVGWTLAARANGADRQMWRWAYARKLIGGGFGAEAIGVLEMMRIDDHDLDLVPAFRLARGAAFTIAGHDEEALAALAAPELSGNAEACAWRLRALAGAGNAAGAMEQAACAAGAINARAKADRAAFLLPAATAALDAQRPAAALSWLRALPDREAAANVLRGRALLAQGQVAEARLRFGRAALADDPAVRADAMLALIEADLAARALAPAEAIRRIDALRYGWRGGPVEARALRVELDQAALAGDTPAQLRSGAALLRYFNPGADTGPMLTRLRATLSTLLAPDSRVPLPQAAGLYWDYRELAPTGAEGDLLALRFADRLQGAGLYARAAQLLQYQLTRRARDVAQGPLSVRVAALQVLAGRPDLALSALQTTEQPGYTDEMRWNRKRMEAVAFYRLGRGEAAFAALDGVPDAAAIRAEMNWRARKWGAFVTGTTLPGAGALREPQQAQILRYAVALAMLGREDALRGLRARYAAAFRGLRTENAFDALTASVSAVEPAKLAAAMGAIPGASPAGAIADLLDSGD
ncbi:MAG: hypothetical protein QM688_05090 [Sphingomonas bacterium]